MPPRRRASARTSLRSSRRSTAMRVFDDEEDDLSMQEQEAEPEPEPEPEPEQDLDEEEAAADPADEEQLEDDMDEDVEGEEDDGDEGGSQEEEDVSMLQPRPRSRRGRGRPRGSSRRSDHGTPDIGDDDGLEMTPISRRGRGRGRGWRGFRNRPRIPRGPSNVVAVPNDADGNPMEVLDDELVLPKDAEGEAKVDANGIMLGDREYRVRTFTILGRGERQYMLSTEPARCMGFRDSYLFFGKHPLLYKVILDDEEKRDLIDRDLMPHSYRSRVIGVVTARSVFREFGCRIIAAGKKIIDDYHVTEARERGDKEGEFADPADAIPIAGRTNNTDKYVAWHGASNIYHNSAAPALQLGGFGFSGKRRVNLTAENWMHEHALAASRFNEALSQARRTTHSGVYDVHTNQMNRPAAFQPTHARWERLAASPPPAKKRKVNGLTNGYLTDPNTNGTNGDVADATEKSDSEPTLFLPLSDVLTRNFLIVDTSFETAPESSLVLPQLHGPQGLAENPITGPPLSSALPQLTAAQAAEYGLPEECALALAHAQRTEAGWRHKWADEHQAGWRGELRIGIGI